MQLHFAFLLVIYYITIQLYIKKSIQVPLGMAGTIVIVIQEWNLVNQVLDICLIGILNSLSAWTIFPLIITGIKIFSEVVETCK